MLDPGNLSPGAREDLLDILERSTGLYGIARADRLESDIIGRCREIADGHGLGHVRSDAPQRRSLRFWPMPPFVIVYDADTCLVIRILHGRRDIPAVLGRTS